MGRLKPELDSTERDSVYFSQGLASILILNTDLARAGGLARLISCSTLEHWPIVDGNLDPGSIVCQSLASSLTEELGVTFAASGLPEVDVYIEQIVASLSTLWHSYGIQQPEERETLRAAARTLQGLIARYRAPGATAPRTVAQRRNAVISALVELSAALSYAAAQGCSGSSPILTSRSPFPHHSLLGIGGAVRALTQFTRYLETAFARRSAAKVITKEYPQRRIVIPRISTYDSGPTFKAATDSIPGEEFDLGGDLIDENSVPLITQFSLRHGFKESKFSVTAASESLSIETIPPWTLMTLSHEIMHSRVRHIFQVLFGTTWEEVEPLGDWKRYYAEYREWSEAATPSEVPMDRALRILVINFCCAMARSRNPVSARRSLQEREIDGPGALFEEYREHKRLAVEHFVHFHDYYFAYACQPRLYIMSLWASWTKVAAPFLRPTEYLVRTLSTVAAGTGLTTQAAYEYATGELAEALDTLEARGVKSPIFDEVRELMDTSRDKIFALFKPSYYLADHVRKYFASRVITQCIDKLGTDPFADGSFDAEEYTATVYAFGPLRADEIISPIRFSLAALVRELAGTPLLDDNQWLTAWNSIVIGSQEVR